MSSRNEKKVRLVNHLGSLSHSISLIRQVHCHTQWHLRRNIHQAKSNSIFPFFYAQLKTQKSPSNAALLTMPCPPSLLPTFEFSTPVPQLLKCFYFTGTPSICCLGPAQVYYSPKAATFSNSSWSPSFGMDRRCSRASH